MSTLMPGKRSQPQLDELPPANRRLRRQEADKENAVGGSEVEVEEKDERKVNSHKDRPNQLTKPPLINNQARQQQVLLLNGLSRVRQANEDAAEGADSAKGAQVGQGGEDGCDEDENGDERRFYCHDELQFGSDEMEEDDDEDEEGEEFEDYMRLDTIVEEDELNEDEAMGFAANKRQQVFTAKCSPSIGGDNRATRHARYDESANELKVKSKGRPQAERASNLGGGGSTLLEGQQRANRTSTPVDDKTNNSNINNNNNNNQSNSNNNMCDRTASTNPIGAQDEEEEDEEGGKAQSKQRAAISSSVTSFSQQQQQQQQQPAKVLPSTNRLISEHQMRQQQTLFRALAERQKLMDELGADVDLMTGSGSASLRRIARQRRQERSRRRSRQSAGAKRANEDDEEDELDYDDDNDNDDEQAARQRRKSRRRKRRQRKRQLAARRANKSAPEQEQCVPLSAVDLSSMSDRMLDELLGQIASASSSSSSSSLSSNGDSLDSSDLSQTGEDLTTATSTTSSASDDEDNFSANQRRQQLLPNVIGVHEDERTRPSAATGDTCRDAHKRHSEHHHRHDSGDSDSDHHRHNDHELRIHTNPAGSGACEPTDESLSPSGEQYNQRRTQPHRRGTRLEQYFTSALVNPHEYGNVRRASPMDRSQSVASNSNQQQRLEQQQQEPNSAPVEEVLMRMLEALNEIGVDEQEQLNELLERGFTQLEELLNCSLAPSSTMPNAAHQLNDAIFGEQAQPLKAPANANTNQLMHRSQLNLAQKLISTPAQVASAGQVSGSNKDSDYGSDTQSAECLLSQSNVSTNANNCQMTASSDSPSPSSLTTTTSSTSSSSSAAKQVTDQQAGGSAAAKTTSSAATLLSSSSSLSPLAVELSFKLAESLRRLAQQQQQQQQQQVARQRDVGYEQQLADDELIDDDEDEHETLGGEQLAATAPKTRLTTTPTTKRSPMKSIVMINSTRSPSAASIVSSNSSSSSSFANHLDSASSARRNTTPNCALDQANQQQQQPPVAGSPRQQFKTRVNLGTGEVSNVIVGGRSESRPITQADCSDSTCRSGEINLNNQQQVAVSGETATGRGCAIGASANTNQSDTQKTSKKKQQQQQQQVESNKLQDSDKDLSKTSRLKRKSSAPGEEVQIVEVGGGVSQVTSQLERRRSARSSLRRRPSFSGSTGSTSREPRPGSPLPRLPLGRLERELESPTMGRLTSNLRTPESLDGGAASGEPQQQRKLQRALILAQKYNYSPARLAASKLSSKLQLKEFTKGKQTALPAESGGSKNQLNNHQTKLEHDQRQNIPPAGRTSEQVDPSAGNQKQKALGVTGKVQLDISYFAKSGSLTVHVLQCAQLAPVNKRKTTSNPYVKLYLLPDRSKSGKRKSSIQRSQLEPKFDEKFTFGPIKFAHFEEKILWLSVWHKDRLGRNEFLGEILLALSEIRHQLLVSDLCQSTGARWYQLCERLDTLALVRSGGIQSPLVGRPIIKEDSISGDRDLASSINSNERRQEELLRLDELQRRAARLSDAAAVAANCAPPTPPVAREAINARQASEGTLMRASLGPPVVLAGQQAPITGQLFVALKFVPANEQVNCLPAGSGRSAANLEGALHVMIKEAHNIAGFYLSLASASGTNQEQQPSSGVLPNPFCKCYLVASNGRRLAKQRTPHLKRTANPRWDHKCVFGSVRLSALASQAIEIQLFNRDSTILVSAKHQYLGGIRLCGAGPKPAHLADPQSDASSLASSEHSNNNASNTNNNASLSIEESTNTLSSTTSTGATNCGSSLTGSGRTRPMHRFGSSSIDSAAGELDQAGAGALCSERESRLWDQMLARPNIWVYGELKLRALRPLIAS